jgi:pimeloyl-ACP methyl ester carboxylesterase
VEPEPFKLHVERDVLQDLRVRLERTRRVRGIAAPDWKHGVDPSYLDELIAYWLNGFDWQLQEEKLNAQPHYRASVDGARLHFVHARGRGSENLPLLLLHGWPDSFLRYVKLIPILADPRRMGFSLDDAFDVVVPSLPGFPLTGPVAHPAGRSANRHSAQLLWRLMTEVLGYERFAVAGGDGGSMLAQILAIDYPDSVIAIHLTDIGWHATDVNMDWLSRAEAKYVRAAHRRFLADGAYAAVQMSQPRSLAVGLNDSPVGLASWIVDRFHSWSDPRADFRRAFRKDVLLTNIMLYWTTQTIGSSMLSYYSEAHRPSLTPSDYVDCPVGLALFPFDGAGVPPRSFAERTLNVRRYARMSSGGHFAALEVPGLLVREIFDFLGPLRRWNRIAASAVRRAEVAQYAREPG